MRLQITYYLLVSIVFVLFNTLALQASALSFQEQENDHITDSYLSQDQDNHQETQSTYSRFNKNTSPIVEFAPVSFTFKKSCHEIIQHHDYLYILHYLYKNDEHNRYQFPSFCHDPVSYYIFTLEKIVI